MTKLWGLNVVTKRPAPHRTWLPLYKRLWHPPVCTSGSSRTRLDTCQIGPGIDTDDNILLFHRSFACICVMCKCMLVCMEICMCFGSLSLSLSLSLSVTHTHTCRWCFWRRKWRWRDCHNIHISDGVSWRFFGKRNRNTTVVQEKSHPASREDSDNLPANFRKLQNVRPFHLFKNCWFHVDEYRAIHFDSNVSRWNENVSLHRLSISSVLNLCMLSTILKGLQLNGRTLLTRWKFTLILKSKFMQKNCENEYKRADTQESSNLFVIFILHSTDDQLVQEYFQIRNTSNAWPQLVSIHEMLINVLKYGI